MNQTRCSRQSTFSAEQALGRHRQGDGQAIGELIREFDPMMRAVARRYLTAPADVDDAVQDAWASFVRAQHTIAHPERLAGWLCVTAARAALGISRRLRRSEAVDDDRLATMACPWTDDLDGIDDVRRRRQVRRALARLNARDLLLIELLMSGEDISYATISARTGCAIGSIGPTRQRVLAKLARDPAVRDLAADRAG